MSFRLVVAGPVFVLSSVDANGRWLSQLCCDPRKTTALLPDDPPAEPFSVPGQAFLGAHGPPPTIFVFVLMKANFGISAYQPRSQNNEQNEEVKRVCGLPPASASFLYIEEGLGLATAGCLLTAYRS